jgi:hypothetical protein
MRSWRVQAKRLRCSCAVLDAVGASVSVEIEQTGRYGAAKGKFGCQRLCDSGGANALELSTSPPPNAQVRGPKWVPPKDHRALLSAA